MLLPLLLAGMPLQDDGRSDRELAEVARRLRFRPAMLEGIAVPFWTRFPISVAPVGR